MLHFADAITKLCTKKYNSMKKTGKPAENEWTVLAGIILRNPDDVLSLVSLATGTKCLGGKELTNTDLYELGNKLSDSHAEILARRAFLRYLYDQIDVLFTSGDSEVFMLNINNRIELKIGVSFHFYCSQSPCGDCSIIPMSEDKTYNMNKNTKRRKIERENSSTGNESKVTDDNSTISDIHRTGAKCLATETKHDLHLAGTGYHTTGPLRTKPGRGDPTLSLSCSDKIAKWNVIGIQGTFLSSLIPTLRLESIVIGGESPFSKESMKRGLYKRFGDNLIGPNIHQSTIPFPHEKNSKRTHPCPSSIVWCAVRNRDTEIAVEGRKQGATRNKKGNGLLISRRALFRTFLKTLDNYQLIENIPSHPKKIDYYHCKQWCVSYCKQWRDLRNTTFSAWPDKPTHLQRFAL